MDAQAVSTALRDLSRALVEPVARAPEAEAHAAPAEPRAEDAPVALSRTALAESVADLNEYVRPFNTRLSFSVDEGSGQTIIRISDRETGEVIREVPPSELLQLAARLAELVGLTVDETA